MKKQKRHNSSAKLIGLLSSIFTHIKFAIRFAIITFIATIISIVIILSNTDPNRYKKDITSSIELITGAEVKIDGNLKWRIFSFEPALEIEKISIKNKKWATNENIMTADNITAIISLKHLFKREIALTAFILDKPNIYLEISKKGSKNWEIKKDKTKVSDDSPTKDSTIEATDFKFDINNISVKNAEIFYNNQQTKTTDKIKIDDLLITSNSYEKPLLLNIETTYRNIPISGDFKTRSLKEIIDNPDKIPLTGMINANGIKTNFSGILDTTNQYPAISATATLSAPNIADSLKLTSDDFPYIAPVSGEVELIATPTFISLKKINLHYGTADLTGTAEITIQKNKKPNIKANLNIPLFDIPNLFYPKWEKAYFHRLATGEELVYEPSEPIKDPKAFRNIPLPVKELNLADINLELHIGKLKAMPEMEIDNINLKAILNNGRGIIAPFSCEYMGGTVTLDAIASNHNDTFNGQVSIKAEDINVGKIIDSTGYKNLIKGGNSNLDAVLKGSGPNLAIFMKNLNGYIKAYTTNEMLSYKIENILMANDLVSSIFKFIGRDIIGTIAQVNKKEEKSHIQCIVANLNIENGKTQSNRGIAMQTDIANIIIDGIANLGDEYVDVSIITVVKEGFGVSNNLAEMIKIKGAMAEPDIIINKDGVINNVAKTTFTTAILGALTGGVSLVTTGIGLVTKSWLNNIQADKRPCLTAFEGKSSASPEDFANQIVIKEKLQNRIEKQKNKLNSITTSKIEKEKEKIKSQNQ